MNDSQGRRGALPSQGHRGALPAQPTSFVGREDELAQLGRLLDEHRLVTVTGPGGVGKTRLVVAAAQAGAADFPAGVYLADLAPIDAELLPETIATAVGLIARAEPALEPAIHARLGTGRSLLILDNCEHVLEAASGFVTRLRAACPALVVLATSRERLAAGGEQTFTVPPLSLVGPGTGGPKGSEAETLFLDRARALDPALDADPELIGEVCARCDGLPLAIELAAARCASLGVDGLLAGLDDRLRLLAGSRVPNQRHRSLRAVLDWSHDLLDAGEQRLLRRLGVFAGPFDLTAAAAVTGRPAGSLIDPVGRLTDKHLLEHQSGPAGSRWRMLEVVRSYAREQLAASGEEARVWADYRQWARVTAVDLERRLDTGERWRDEFHAVAADLRATLTASGGDPAGRLSLAMALAHLHARSGAFTLAQAAYEEVMTLARAAGDADQLAQAALGASVSGMLFGVTQDGRVTLLEEALTVHDEPDGTRVRLLARLATELYWSTDRLRSITLASEACLLAEQLRDDGALAQALYARHYVTRRPGNWQDRLELAEQIVSLARRAGETQLELAGHAAHVVGLMEAGELAVVDRGVAALGAAADRFNHPEFRWYAAVYRLVRALVAGHFDDADELAAAAATAAEYAPEFQVGRFFAEAASDLRDLHEEQRYERGFQLREMAGRFPRVTVWSCLLLLNELDQGSRAGVAGRARALRDELVGKQARDGHWLLGCCLLAEAVAGLGDRELARSLADALRPFAGELAVAGRVAAFRGSVSHALGLLALTLGEVDQAVGDLKRAAEQHRRIGARPFRARSLAALASALAARSGEGDHDRAAAVGGEAEELATQLGIRTP